MTPYPCEICATILYGSPPETTVAEARVEMTAHIREAHTDSPEAMALVANEP